MAKNNTTLLLIAGAVVGLFALMGMKKSTKTVPSPLPMPEPVIPGQVDIVLSDVKWTVS